MGKLLADIKSPVKLAVMGVLLVLSVWLVWRNVFAPVPTTSASRSALIEQARTGSQAAGAQRRGQSGSEIAADPDPTLRLDLLEATRKVEYKGSSRNIFQVYTPPPPPPPPPPVKPPVETASQPPGPPPPPPIPLKFYGTAQSSGRQPRKAFLIDGEEIFIAQEGDTVAKSFKIIRIGPTSIELEDLRSNRRQQLPLIEE